MGREEEQETSGCEGRPKGEACSLLAFRRSSSPCINKERGEAAG